MSTRCFMNRSDYLWLAVTISLLLHGAVLFYFWPLGSSAPKSVLEPDISLINYQTDAEAVSAVLLAQWQAAGGGSDEAQQLRSAPFSGQTVPSPNALVLLALQERLRQAEAEQQQRLVQLEAEWQVMADRLNADAQAASNQPQPHNPTQQLLALEFHALKEKLNQYNTKPRIHFEGPSAQASPFAAYIEAWRAKIERLGTEHYPEQAKGQLSDALQMTVYIDQEGNLLQVHIHQPAQNPLFNIAAQRIVRLAAPYNAFTAEMRAQTDVLAITRSWHFTQGNLKTD